MKKRQDSILLIFEKQKALHERKVETLEKEMELTNKLLFELDPKIEKKRREIDKIVASSDWEGLSEAKKQKIIKETIKELENE
jgi:hypothetical protein